MNYKLTDLVSFLENNGYKKFLAKQLFDWLYVKRIMDFNLMTNISNDTKKFLIDNFSTTMPIIKKIQTDNDTKKYLISLVDGLFVEAVLMQHDYGLSICVSSQVGCNMGCHFCESGRLKKVRDLETYEMVSTILIIEKECQKRIDSVVIMGIGEPFDNYDNVMSFIKIINDPFGINIGARHITVSTCGIIPKIKEFMNEDMQVNLAISLHAPTDKLRSEIMNVNKVYNLEQLIATLKEYIEVTNRRVTLEYVMLNNVNDSISCATKLANLIRGMNVYVNLIPYNETNHLEYTKSKKEQMMLFYDQLKKEKINVTIRREFGRNIDAACGQLRSKEVK